MDHSFDSFCDYHPRYDEDRTFHVCARCGLQIVDPRDLYVVDSVPPIEALTPEWLQTMGYYSDCDVSLVAAIHES